MGIIHLDIRAHQAVEKDGGHGSYILMTKTQIGASKTRIPGPHGRDADCTVLLDHMPGENLLRQGHRPWRGFDWRKRDLALHARDVEVEKPAVFDNLARDRIFTRGETGQWNLLPRPDLVDKGKIRRR